MKILDEYECFVHCISDGFVSCERRHSKTQQVDYCDVRLDRFERKDWLCVKERMWFRWYDCEENGRRWTVLRLRDTHRCTC